MNKTAMINELQQIKEVMLNKYLENMIKMRECKDMSVRVAYYLAADDFIKTYNDIVITISKYESEDE